jgi:hypothetical protein
MVRDFEKQIVLEGIKKIGERLTHRDLKSQEVPISPLLKVYVTPPGF